MLQYRKRIILAFLYSGLLLSACSSPFHGSINYQKNPDFEGKTFAVAPPQQSLAIQRDIEYNGKAFTPKWNWEEKRLKSDSIVQEMYSLYYGHELATTPSDSLWNSCLDWKNGGPAYVWSRRNDVILNQQDTFWLYLPAVKPEECKKIDKDLLIIPGVPMIYPAAFGTGGIAVQVESIVPLLLIGNAVWDNRTGEWSRIAAEQSGELLPQDTVSAEKEKTHKENNLMRKMRYSFDGIPEGRDWESNYNKFLAKFNGIEFFISGAFTKPALGKFKDVGIESDMSFMAMNYSLGIRYHLARWAAEASWSKQDIAYGKSIEGLSENQNVNGEWALTTQRFLLGAQYSLGIKPGLDEGLTFFAIGAGAGYEKVDSWHPISEYTEQANQPSQPSDLFMVYVRPGFGYRNTFAASMDMPLECAIGKDGYRYQIGLQFTMGLVL